MVNKHIHFAAEATGTQTGTLAPERERAGSACTALRSSPASSCLGQWPVKLRLATANAPYLQNADLLIAADCTAFAYAQLHKEYMQGRVTLVGCPKLDAVDYKDTLLAILQGNQIGSLTVVRMEESCCAGLAHAAFAALEESGKAVPWQVATISTDGKVLHEIR